MIIQPGFIEFSLQLLELEQLWIGTSARSAILANPKRATATPIAIAPKTISVDMTTAEIFGIWRSWRLIVVFQVILFILFTFCETNVIRYSIKPFKFCWPWLKSSEVKLLGGSGHFLDCYIWYTCHTFNSKSSEVKLWGGSGHFLDIMLHMIHLSYF